MNSLKIKYISTQLNIKISNKPKFGVRAKVRIYKVKKYLKMDKQLICQVRFLRLLVFYILTQLHIR